MIPHGGLNPHKEKKSLSHWVREDKFDQNIRMLEEVSASKKVTKISNQDGAQDLHIFGYFYSSCLTKQFIYKYYHI